MRLLPASGADAFEMAAQRYGVALVLETARRLAEVLGDPARAAAYRAAEEQLYSMQLELALMDRDRLPQVATTNPSRLVWAFGLASAWSSRERDKTGGVRPAFHQLVPPGAAQNLDQALWPLLTDAQQTQYARMIGSYKSHLAQHSKAIETAILERFALQDEALRLSVASESGSRRVRANVTTGGGSKSAGATRQAQLNFLANDPPADHFADSVLAAIGAPTVRQSSSNPVYWQLPELSPRRLATDVRMMRRRMGIQPRMPAYGRVLTSTVRLVVAAQTSVIARRGRSGKTTENTR